MDYLAALEKAWVDISQTWKPPPKLSASEWADRYFVLSPESSAEPGRWRTIPYQKAILDAMTHPRIEKIAWKKSARVGYTKCINIAIAYHVHQDPCSVLVVQPTVDDAKGYSKDEIAPMLRDVPVLDGLVADPKSRSSGNTIEKKSYPGGTLNLIGANSARGFRRLTVRLVFFDEIDGYPPTAGQEGDQLALGIRRTETFWNRKIVLGSTPTEEGLSRIEKEYGESDGGAYYVPCPHCNEYQTLQWANLIWEKGKPDTAAFKCVKCAQLIGHNHKRWMVENGEWRGKHWTYKNGEFHFGDEFDGYIGFFIWAAYSYSPNAAWPKLVREFLSVKKDREKFKTFVNTVWGETWQHDGDQVEHGALYKRREHYSAQIPDDVVLLTGGVDVQADRFEFEITGWGAGEESWLIAYERLYGNVDEPVVWDVLAEMLKKSYRRVNGAEMSPMLVCIDSGYRPDEVYAFSKKYGRLKYIPTKGHSESGKPVHDFPRKPNKHGVYLTMIGTDTVKDINHERLSQLEPGPGYCHFPISEATDETYFKQLTVEKRKPVFRRGVRFNEWVKPNGARNEPWDCRGLSFVALRLLKTYRGIDLDKLAMSAAESRAAAANKPQPTTKGRRVISSGVKL